MIKVTVIGSGNLAHHFIEVFHTSPGIEIQQVFSRNHTVSIPELLPHQIVTSYDALTMADVYLICVSDDAIAEVSQSLPFDHRLVVHTSGAMPLTTLDKKNKRGVFYPLQTFTKGKKVDFTTIPLCIETESEKEYPILETLAKTISTKVYAIHSEQRKALHLAAVFVNNFTNYLYQIGQEICEEHQIPFEILQPLILETAQKIQTLTPSQAQTGPAKRNDTHTIMAHQKLLTQEHQRTIYNILTQSIQNHGKKL